MPEIRNVKILDLKTHPEPHVTARELAEYFGLSDETIYKFARAGTVETVRIGRSIRIVTESARMLPERLREPRPGERLNGQATD